MIDWQQRVAMWVLAGVVAYVTYRWLFVSKESSATDYEQELQKILTSDKYKVKGRFEE
ncbi:hypothetical protein HYU20_03745 [Candidatus Woesearchaeota archaeon]|nr:hypothetical protein [Candidatus Woesearchaeota archaeon]